MSDEPTRRRFRFGLRTLFVVTGLLALLSAQIPKGQWINTNYGAGEPHWMWVPSSSFVVIFVLELISAFMFLLWILRQKWYSHSEHGLNEDHPRPHGR